MSLGNPPKEINPRHISNLMETDRIVVRYYKGKRRLEKIEFDPTTLEEYLNHFKDTLSTKPQSGSKGGDSNG